MKMISIQLFVFWLSCFVCVVVSNEDIPCAARAIPGQSAVCVCNSTYCDTITRITPERGHYVSYTSSSGGLRFKKNYGQLFKCLNSGCPQVTLELDPSTKYQVIEGFGGAVTDAAAINWRNLSVPLQKKMIDSYFSRQGLQYNVIRTPVAGADFSTHPYAYNDLPTDDVHLTNFTLAPEDLMYKIPMIKQAMAASEVPIHVVASSWSPPVWMKTNHKYTGYNRLKPEYYQTLADYYYKFIDHYTTRGIPIWAITTTNEPTNGVSGIIFINCLGWTPSTMGQWIINNLGPTIKNSTYKDVKILISDDQRLTLPFWVTSMIREHPDVLRYIDGVAVHFYTNFLAPPAMVTDTMKHYPDKFIISTEASEGSFPWQKNKVELGSWHRAYSYIYDIITNLNSNLIGWIDWNLCLNEHGGPNWVKNFVDSPIIVFPDRDEFYKQPMFYAMGHFSKFIPRGSQRVLVNMQKSFFNDFLESVAFLTPTKTVVLVVYNSGNAQMVNIKIGDEFILLYSPKQSVTTVEFPYEGVV